MFAIRTLSRAQTRSCLQQLHHNNVVVAYTRRPITTVVTPVTMTKSTTTTTFVKRNYRSSVSLCSSSEIDVDVNQEQAKPRSSSSSSSSSDPTAIRRLDHKIVSNRTREEIEKWREDSQISVTGDMECPDPILSFDEAPFHFLTKSALQAKFPAPLPIQSQGWSVAMSGVNMVGCADTGSGKTIAFILPALEHIKKQAPMRRGDGPIALVLAPTRELAQQIESEALNFARLYGVRVACLFGGQGNRGQQIRKLEYGPALVVATPGRLLDLIEAGHTNLSRVNFLILDEADRMLEMGFEDDLRRILSMVQEDRQTCMWTATWPKKINALALEYFHHYVKVNVGSHELTANPNVTQIVDVLSRPEERFRRLEKLLIDNPDKKFLIFVDRKSTCEQLGWKISEIINKVASIHGDKTQAQRDNILRDFKSSILTCVLATDVASRGLDVKDIDFVINYDMPNNIESYIHRIGRTARAGRKGTAISFFTRESYHIIHDLLDVLKEAKQTIPPALTDVLRHEEEIKQAKMRLANQNKRKVASSAGGYGDKWSTSTGSRGGMSVGGNRGGMSGGSSRGGMGGGSRMSGSIRGGFDYDNHTYVGRGGSRGSSRGGDDYGFSGGRGGRGSSYDDDDFGFSDRSSSRGKQSARKRSISYDDFDDDDSFWGSMK